MIRYLQDKEYIPVCPEVEAGMPVPRPPVEIRDGRVISIEGKDLNAVYRRGVAKVMEILQKEEIGLAILKAKSPTCGVHEIYDGTFTGKKIPGQGLLAQALQEAGIPILDENDLEKQWTADRQE